MTSDCPPRRPAAVKSEPLFAQLGTLKARLQLVADRTNGRATSNGLDTGTSAHRRRRSPPNLCVGFDIVSVAEVAASLDRFGDRYVRRIFTGREASYCLAAAASAAAARFAARFAAKEAAVKALQPDRHWTDWRAIEVRRHRSGRCTLVLRGQAALLASRRGIQELALSMTHDGDRAAAIVVALRAAPARHSEAMRCPPR
jgi:holo-[acyl-carrier protein] synthase